MNHSLDKKGCLILAIICVIGLIIWTIISAYKDYYHTAENGMYIAFLACSIAGFLVIKAIINKCQSKGKAIVLSILTFGGFVALVNLVASHIELAFFVGVIMLVAITIGLIIWLWSIYNENN